MDFTGKYSEFFSHLRCPYCKTPIESRLEQIDIPHFGETIVLHLGCRNPNCSFKTNDLFSVFTKDPKRFLYKCVDESDLNAKIIKSGSCTIRLPEFGIEIEPSIASEGYITNIEGILQRVLSILKLSLNDLEDPKRKDNCQYLIDRVIKAIDGQESFTLILEDPYGNSAIISNDSGKLKSESLSNEELEELKVSGSFVFDMPRDEKKK